MSEKNGKPPAVLGILSRPIVALVERVNKRLRFSITFKTTALYTLNFFLSLLMMGIVLVIFLAALLVYIDYQGLAQSGQIIGADAEKSAVIAEVTGYDIAVLDEDGNSIFESRPESVSLIDRKFWQYSNVPWFRTNMPYAFYIDLQSKAMSVRIDVGPPAISSGSLDGEVSEDSGEASDIIDTPENDGASLGMSEEAIAYTVYVTKPVMWEWLVLQGASIGMGAMFLFAMVRTARKGSAQTGRMLSPIHDMTLAARSISYHELHMRINPINTHDELKELAETFNEMLDRIQATSIMQNRFVSDASHELRTPVTVIQGYANMLSRWGNDDKAVLDESITAIKGESESMKALLESLLFLTRAEKDTQRVEKSLFALDELIDEVARETRMIDHTHRITGFIEKGVGLNGDRGLIKQAVRVFVENSMKYTPSGGTIAISCYVELEEAAEPKHKRDRQKRGAHYSGIILDKLRQAGFTITTNGGLRVVYNSKDSFSAEKNPGVVAKNNPDVMRVNAGEEDAGISDYAPETEHSEVRSSEGEAQPRNGHVIIEKREPAGDRKGRAIVVISDTGVGIASKDIPHIFDRFYRCDESRARESGGTGLGLSIAKWIVERHFGDITVESKVGAGTRIVIRLPEWTPL